MNTEEMYLENMSYREYKSPQRQARERHEKRKKKSNVILSSADMSLMIIVIFLVITGFLAIFSATAPKCMREGLNVAAFTGKQFIYAITGFAAMGFLAHYDYKKLEKFNIKFLWAVITLLLILQFTPLGVSVNGAKRWINLGIMQLQPSEFAKPLFCMLLASMFKDKINTEQILKNIWIILSMIVILILILKQPNLSMTIILFMAGLVCYIAGKGPWIPIYTGAAVIGAGILTMLPKLLQGYQMDRITIWLNPGSDALGKGYNIIQSLIAFASGGFFGSGYGSSVQKLAYLPECHTDFIFAIIGEEFGFAGCFFVIGLFAALVHRGMRVAKRCPDMYGKLLAIGITFIFGFQAFLNMAVASSFCPVTGVTLPFISYGGTSIIVSLAMVGVLLNISKLRIKRIRTEVNE